MLEKYYVRSATLDRIRGSWLGPVIEKYVTWLDEHGYSRHAVAARVPTVMHFARFAQLRGATAWTELPGHVDAFVDGGTKFIKRRRTTKLSREKLRAELRVPVEQLLRLIVPDFRPLGRSKVSQPFARELPNFFEFLGGERGLCKRTLGLYSYRLRTFERYLRGIGLADLRDLTPAVLTSFVVECSRRRLAAKTVAGKCGALRVFLRYAHRERVVDRDLSVSLDTPLQYQLATLPRSIEWSDVRKVLEAVDRRDAAGKRDHALILLLVTYGLRVVEVARLTLDDIDWKQQRLRIRDRKVGNSTGYPLSATVAEGLADYLRNARPKTVERRIFVRLVAPIRKLGCAGISSRVRFLLEKAGVEVPRPGAQVLRHTCVQRLVDAELPFKAVSDYVGHRSTASAGAYAKVSVEALRAVALGNGEDVL